MDIIIKSAVCAEPIFQTGDDFSGVQMESGTHLGHILAVIKFLASLIELFYLIENFITRDFILDVPTTNQVKKGGGAGGRT